MIAGHFGYHIELGELRRRYSVSLKGATLNQLKRTASALGLSSRALRLELEEITELRCPCILHWNLNHFVVVEKTRSTISGKVTAVILDPAVGRKTLSLAELSKHFTGIALELLPTENFQRKSKQQTISIAEISGRIIGFRRALAKVILLAIVLEIFAIGSPLFNQFVVDEVIISGDKELLKTLAIGFILLLSTQAAISLARSWFLMRWSIDIGIKLTAKVFAHLIRLPISFFEKRSTGDIVSRFSSINSIQNTLTNIFVESALDGLMAILALIMMIIYSAKLSIIVLLSVIFYLAVRFVFYAPLREASRERTILAAKEGNFFIETLRAMTPIKLFSHEAERQGKWLNLKYDIINRDIETQKLAVLFKVFNLFVSGSQNIAMFYIGAELVMENSLTVGMLMAFSSYAATFSSRIFNLADSFISLKMLDVHLERLSDIALEPAEVSSSVKVDSKRLIPDIVLRDVRFQYAESEPYILDGVNLSIFAGENIAIVGPSGCGKTTLCKIVLGLLSPTAGEITIGATPIEKIGTDSYRKMVGTVMQDDVLLTGSISDNIGFFDANTDIEWVEECAKLAAIHDEIASMPMGYQTLVGDLGSGLSGGQKQRILVARALYKRPNILILDEATSHLDINNERLVNSALKKLQITRITIAHRPETIASADRVVKIEGKSVVDSSLVLNSTKISMAI